MLRIYGGLLRSLMVGILGCREMLMGLWGSLMGKIWVFWGMKSLFMDFCLNDHFTSILLNWPFLDERTWNENIKNILVFYLLSYFPYFHLFIGKAKFIFRPKIVTVSNCLIFEVVPFLIFPKYFFSFP